MNEPLIVRGFFMFMRKESVLLDQQAIAAAPASHREHVRERNSMAGLLIAENILDVPFVGIGEPTSDSYCLLGSPIDQAKARELKIEKRSDFFGAVILDSRQIHKAAFHPSISGNNTPPFHSADLASELTKKGVVLPGITAFREADLVTYFRDEARKDASYRLKISNGSDGEGQHGGITSFEELQKGLRRIGTKDIAENGLILEQEIQNPLTISVGSIVLDGQEYSFYTHQVDEVIEENGEKRTRYLGARDVVVSRGSIAEMPTRYGSPENFALQKAVAFDQIYHRYTPALLSRRSVDVVMDQGGTFGGVTDLTTGRIGGTDPGLLLAIKELVSNPSLKTATANVVLDYGHKLEVPEYAVMFVNQPDLRLFAYVTGKSGEIRLK